jgi:O-antigen/teichoic acid export membrane protein
MFYALSGLTSAVNYLFYPVIARFVTVQQYGEIQFLVSIFGQLSVGFVVLNILAVIISVKVTDQTKQQSAIRALNQLAQLVAIAVCVIGVAFLSAYRQHLTLSSVWPITWVGVGLLINVPFTIVIGRLQGNGRFVASGVLSLASVAIKLFASILFTMAHLGSSGAIAGIAVGLFAAWAIGEWLMSTNKALSRFPMSNVFSKRIPFSELAFLKESGLIALVSIAVLTIISSADSITSRITLGSYEAGQYAAIATITKSILAIATPLMWLALPAAISHARKKVVSLYAITFLLCTSFGVLIIALPSLFTKVLVGVDPGAFLHLTTPATISMILYAVAFVVVASAICFGHLKTTFLSSLIAIILYGVVFTLTVHHHSPIFASLMGQIVSASALLIILLTQILRTRDPIHT